MVSTRTSIKNCDKSTVSAHNLGQIGVIAKTERLRRAYSTSLGAMAKLNHKMA